MEVVGVSLTGQATYDYFEHKHPLLILVRVG